MSEAVDDRRAQKDRVLEAAFLHAPFDGWSRRTLLNAARDAGFDPGTAQRLFPQGGDSLLAWLDDWADRRMLEAATAQNLEQLPVRRRISALVRARLEPLAEHREAMRRAALARGFPGSAMGTGQALWRTADRMWAAAGLGGDARAEGLSFYTRRASLAAVLCATFLHWLEDQSEGFADSWAFLDRRIEDVMRVGRARARVGSWFGQAPGRAQGSAQ